MKNNNAYEFIISAVLIVLLIAFLNPFDIFMPTSLVMMMEALMIIIFGIFASLIWRERAADEREGLHRMIAGRIGFLAGAGVLVVGILVQTLSHSVDPWLVIALTAMILAKIIALIYTKNNK